MQVTLLRAKLHRVRVTAVELDYEGSCAIDGKLLEAAGILPHEQIHLYDVSNGERFVTYAINAPAGSGTISVNGAAARKVAKGDLLIIAAYAGMALEAAQGHQPRVIYVDANNQPRRPEAP